MKLGQPGKRFPRHAYGRRIISMPEIDFAPFSGLVTAQEWKGSDMALCDALRLGLKYGVLLALLNLAWQTIVWFSGLNRFEESLYLFFLFPAIALWLALRAIHAARTEPFWTPATVVALVIAATGSACLIPTMFFFLDVLGHGALPPVLQVQLDALRSDGSGSADVARRIAQLERLTPLGFAIAAAVNTFVLTIILAGPLAALVRLGKRSPRSTIEAAN